MRNHKCSFLRIARHPPAGQINSVAALEGHLLKTATEFFRVHCQPDILGPGTRTREQTGKKKRDEQEGDRGPDPQKGVE